jgi:hypothetical protein
MQRHQDDQSSTRQLPQRAGHHYHCAFLSHGGSCTRKPGLSGPAGTVAFDPFRIIMAVLLTGRAGASKYRGLQDSSAQCGGSALSGELRRVYIYTYICMYVCMYKCMYASTVCGHVSHMSTTNTQQKVTSSWLGCTQALATRSPAARTRLHPKDKRKGEK